jgi:hypothetical protein
VLGCKLVITLVVRRHPHHCAVSDVVEHVRGHVNRELFPSERIDSRRVRLDARLGSDLPVVLRPRRFEERREKLKGTGKPFWSSAAQRYCTSDMKRGPIDKCLRDHQHVICAMGLRASESSARAAKDATSVRKGITTTRADVKQAETAAEARERWTGNDRAGRLALDWNPILHWSERDVWHRIGHSPEMLRERRRAWQAGRHQTAMAGWNAHPAYVRGNERLSCALCILGSRGDLVNGARHNPRAFEHLLQMERESGYTFRQDFSLEEIGDAVDAGEAPRPEMQTELSL